MGMGPARSIFASVQVVALFMLLTLHPASGLTEIGELVEVGDMVTARYNHTADLLSDGKVLVCGGTLDGETPIPDAEIFDPDSGTWERGDSMIESRMRHATALLNGRVIAAGGYCGPPGAHPSLLADYYNKGAVSSSSCEIYDPSIDEWSAGPPLITGRFWHSILPLPSGGLLAIGGLNVSTGALSSCEILEEGGMEWVAAASLNHARARFTATVLPNGSILVTGGHDGTYKTGSASCELYVPSDGVWVEVADMNKGRGYHAASLLHDGRVIVTGGFSFPTEPDHSDGEIYDPKEDSWTLVGEMSFPRHNHDSVVFDDGAVVVIGGSNCATGGCHSTFDLYDTGSGEWKDTGVLNLGRKWTTVTRLDDTRVLIAGGKTCDAPSDFSEVYVYDQGGGGENDTPFPALYLLIAAPSSFLIVHRLFVPRERTPLRNGRTPETGRAG